MTHETVPESVVDDVAFEPSDTIKRFFAAIQNGDYDELLEVLTPDAITRWPQTGELMTGAMACLRVYENYPGSRPSYRVQRISGGDATWVAEVVADYGDERWYVASIVELEGTRIARMTDYFAPRMPAPEWRAEWVEREGG